MSFASCLFRSREGIVCVVRKPYGLELWWRDGEQVNIRRHRKHELCKRVTLSKNVPRMFDTCTVPIITVFESMHRDGEQVNIWRHRKHELCKRVTTFQECSKNVRYLQGADYHCFRIMHQVFLWEDTGQNLTLWWIMAILTWIYLDSAEFF